MSVSLELDHIVVSTTNLGDGIAYVQDTLGVKMAPGGKHPAMGTHNALLGLGTAYLEVIAIDPDAPEPAQPRWFDLDSFTGPPRLTNWVAKTTDLSAAIALAPNGIGTPMDLSRGDLTWQIAIAPDGKLPFGGAFPGLIAWGDTPHPTTRLPDAGCMLHNLRIGHEQGDSIQTALARFDSRLGRCVAQAGPRGFNASINTPNGLAELT